MSFIEKFLVFYILFIIRKFYVKVVICDLVDFRLSLKVGFWFFNGGGGLFCYSIMLWKLEVKKILIVLLIYKKKGEV